MALRFCILSDKAQLFAETFHVNYYFDNSNNSMSALTCRATVI